MKGRSHDHDTSYADPAVHEHLFLAASFSCRAMSAFVPRANDFPGHQLKSVPIRKHFFHLPRVYHVPITCNGLVQRFRGRWVGATAATAVAQHLGRVVGSKGTVPYFGSSEKGSWHRLGPTHPSSLALCEHPFSLAPPLIMSDVVTIDAGPSLLLQAASFGAETNQK